MPATQQVDGRRTRGVVKLRRTVNAGRYAAGARPCRWCGTPTHLELEVEKPRWGIDKLTAARVMKRAAIVAPCCGPCQQRVTAP